MRRGRGAVPQALAEGPGLGYQARMTLTVEGLACRRGGRTIFRDFSCTLPAGRAAALRGPNGVGKSSLLRVLAGFIPPAAGEARMDGVVLTRDRGVFQERVLYAGHLDAVKPALSFEENLGLWAGLNATPEGRVAEALAHFGIDHMADRPAGEGSAGQKRRLGLARLMVMDRPLWLLDEPTVSLDVDSVALVAALVDAHLGDGGLALIATHTDLGLADPDTLAMRPPDPETLGAGDDTAPDPFLAGRW